MILIPSVIVVCWNKLENTLRFFLQIPSDKYKYLYDKNYELHKCQRHKIQNEDNKCEPNVNDDYIIVSIK